MSSKLRKGRRKLYEEGGRQGGGKEQQKQEPKQQQKLIPQEGMSKNKKKGSEEQHDKEVKWERNCEQLDTLMSEVETRSHLLRMMTFANSIFVVISEEIR
eukprot:759276-Hanusia_phi.AAC.2